MGGGLESRCVGRVYGADGARHHPHQECLGGETGGKETTGET